ncbi:MAG TPA: peptide ABC transporter substrate-binding protein, partial [Lacunisphaera sp.]|nr:peptide ABC transporter substrate-binding protein [Lacunisphaera sp.]
MSGWRTRVPLHVLLGAACVFGSFGPGCARREAPLPSDRTLRIGQRNEPATLDPHLAILPDEFFIIRALGEGLLVPNPHGGEPLPGVATHWSVSPDGLTYTFTLRPDATWSNGEPVTAADFVYSIQRVLTPATAAPKVALFHLLRNARGFTQGTVADFAQVGVSARDARTLVLTIERPAPDFPALVASGPWIPVHRGTVETHGAKWSLPGNLIGNGPFILTEWAPNQHILVRKNQAYWDRAAIELDGLLFRAFDSGDTEDRAFRAGELDVTLSVPQAKLDTYRQTSPTLLKTAALHETRYLSLNTTRPPLDDPRVRLALSLALDRQALTGKVLRSGQKPAYHFIPPG